MSSQPQPPGPFAIASGSTRARLIRAALDTAAEVGIDATTTSAVVARAEVSRPTLYSYFGDAQGALADAWVEVGPGWLAAVQGGVEFEEMRRHPWHRVLTALLLAAPRVPELGEVVGPDVHRACVTDPAGAEATLRAVWSLAIEIGTTTAVGVVDGIERALLILPMVHTLPADARARVGVGDTAWVVPPITMRSPVTEPSPDPTTAALLRASVGVVARAGVPHASMMRICRAARVTTGAAKPRFENVHDLVLQGFEVALDEVVSSNVGQLPGLEAADSPWDAAATFTVAGLDPARAEWRRYRQELYLAAFHDPSLAGALRAAVARTDKWLESTMLGLGLDTDVVELSLAANHAATLGFGALHALGVPVETMDHRVMYRWMAEPLRS